MIRSRRPLRSVGAAAALALLLMLALAGSAAGAERATFRLLGSSPIYSQVDVHKAAGGSVKVRPARYHYRITVDGETTEASGHCVDMSHYIVTGRDYQVDLQSAADAPELGSPEYLAAGWLLSQEDDLIAAASNPSLEAGAIQVALWQLSGQARELSAPTSNAALNARVAELRALAAGKSVPTALDVAIEGPSAGTCLDTSATVWVTGTPGAVVDLSVTGGEGAVAPEQVVIDGSGSAQASLSGASVGEVTVTATTSAPTLLRATKLAGESSPQDQLFLRPGTLSASASQAFIDCGVFELSPGPESKPFDPSVLPTPAAPPAPPAAPAPAPAADPLAIALTTPKLAAPGGVAVYTLRVTNTTKRVARNVVVRQRLGRGVAAIRATGPKGTRVRAGKSAATWKVRSLRPGRTATLRLKVRVGRRVAGGIARTSASLRSGSRSARAAGTTAIVRRVGKTEQGF